MLLFLSSFLPSFSFMNQNINICYVFWMVIYKRNKKYANCLWGDFLQLSSLKELMSGSQNLMAACYRVAITTGSAFMFTFWSGWPVVPVRRSLASQRWVVWNWALEACPPGPGSNGSPGKQTLYTHKQTHRLTQTSTADLWFWVVRCRGQRCKVIQPDYTGVEAGADSPPIHRLSSMSCILWSWGN